jgi:multiple sugar transport system permease protein
MTPNSGRGRLSAIDDDPRVGPGPGSLEAGYAVAERARRHRARRWKRAWTGYLLILPALIPFLCFIVGPLVGAVFLSFFKYDLLTPATYTGLGNWRHLVDDSEAWNALRVTLTFTLASVVLHVAVGLGLALAVNRKMPAVLRYGLRTAIFFPVLISWAVVSLIAEYTFDPNFGFIPYYLNKVGVHNVDWFTNPHTALAAIVGVDLWHTVGFSFIVLVAGLQGIPQHLYEAAWVDGAGPLRVLRSITLPLLSPSLFFVIVISFIGAFQIFEPVHIITNGGPGDSTETIVQYIYDQGFSQLRMGYAATLGLVVLGVLLVVTLLQFGAARFWVHNEIGD